jgi:hypothetical protein
VQSRDSKHTRAYHLTCAGCGIEYVNYRKPKDVSNAYCTRECSARNRPKPAGSGQQAKPLIEWFRTGPLNDCWPWLGSHSNGGYGTYRGNPAHRGVYEALVGAIPEGMYLDHTCHNDASCPGGSSCPHRACVNPFHLEPVSNKENILRGESPAAKNARKTHCPYGHPLDGVIHLKDRIARRCLTCHRLRQNAAYHSRGEA